MNFKKLYGKSIQYYNDTKITFYCDLLYLRLLIFSFIDLVDANNTVYELFIFTISHLY